MTTPTTTSETEERGEDGLTASERMKIFDALPREIRRVLMVAADNYDVRDIAHAWAMFRIQGWSPLRAARHFKRDFDELTYQKGHRT